MKQLRLVRLETDNYHGTFGALLIDGETFCVTLEPYNRDNAQNVSCIPPGQYFCKKVVSPRFGKTFGIDGVQGRSNILFHWGNIDDHTEGCVLLGQYFGILAHNRGVLNSGNTFEKFMNLLSDVDEVKLTIVECY